MSDATDVGSLCAKWWAGLVDGASGRARADLAQLRRASAAIEALSHPATHRLHHRLVAAGCDLQTRPETLAALVMTLVHVKTAGPRFAVVAGQGDPARLSSLRFERLIRSQEPTELARQLRRALAQVGHQADVAALARDVVWWTDATRARWCFEYYGASEATADSKYIENHFKEVGA